MLADSIGECRQHMADLTAGSVVEEPIVIVFVLVLEATRRK